MRRAAVTVTATTAGVILLLSLKPHEGGTAAAPITSDSSGSTGSSGSGSESGSVQATEPSAGATRSITGNAVSTRYGPVQVKVTLTGTKITKIDVVQYPTRDRRDQEINSYALPVLNQEAIAAQSANVDVVSGATFTSDGYARSLQSALDKAAG
ncbi:FMN-binding protein [Kitasatospora paracochleata]|uniref:Uncharacterized protein with FMN-binding domain n=1 Tax=Kitasatospora paracochleata TaxID=58354 RepID=A0ABT1IS68_9ACTN|nr:FMN-binding protein [Kitasatospora paracochleata]MCP2307973.1 uncharacterized protein with FMN-binding domain [Kitasatospora paracochleata]